ncbi:MAG: L-2-hydroxyglutarate oxidase [Pirellulales bacterium]
MDPMQPHQVIVIGGGIVGLATAYRITDQFPEQKVVLLEKESTVGTHQTGHNSGVLHSGIYYKPGSLKAKNCRVGKKSMEAFCDAQGIPHETCGKVIVAVDENELPRLKQLFDRGQQNGVKCEMIDADRLRELEPYAAGIRAIHVPEAGIVNYSRVCERLAEIVQERDGQVVCDARVTGLRQDHQRVLLQTTQGEFEASCVVNCTGLHSDRVTRMSGQKPDAKIIPFRGEYYELKPEAHRLCNNLLYPVPDPKFPFLGVHFTRMIEGGVECGPNAVLAFAREGYRKRDINVRDLAETLTYPGFVRMAARHWRMGMGEMWRSFSKAAFVAALQRLVPAILREHLVPTRAGVRAQAIASDGSMVDDFLIQEGGRVVNVGNAPSPAATAALNIAGTILERLAPRLE